METIKWFPWKLFRIQIEPSHDPSEAAPLVDLQRNYQAWAEFCDADLFLLEVATGLPACRVAPMARPMLAFSQQTGMEPVPTPLEEQHFVALLASYAVLPPNNISMAVFTCEVVMLNIQRGSS